MAHPGAHVREAEIVQQARDRALVILHPEAVPDNLLEVEPAPAHDAVAVRPRLDDLRQRHPLHRRQLRNRAGRFVVVQALGPA